MGGNVTTFVPADAVSHHLAYIPCIVHGPLATLHHGCNPVTHVRACDPTSHVPNTPLPRLPCPSSCTIVPFSRPSPGASRAIVLTSTIACSFLLGPTDRHPPHLVRYCSHHVYMYPGACCMAPQFDLLNPLRFSLPLEPQTALDPLNTRNTAHLPHSSSVHLDSAPH